jgi:predicted transposase/invertase (TIGR01784 family)
LPESVRVWSTALRRAPILDVEVLNPELPKTRPGQRGAEVDVLVRFAGGRRVHVEIQIAKREGFIGRSLFYWARTFAQQLARGDDYSKLAATSGIFILDYRLLPDPDYHHVFGLFERTRRRELTDLLALHYLELPKIPQDFEAALSAATNPPPVLKWAAFLAAKSDHQLERLAMIDPTMKNAVDALERLSEDPHAQDAAYLRSIEAADYEAELQRRFDSGVRQGVEKGVQKCFARGIE